VGILSFVFFVYKQITSEEQKFFGGFLPAFVLASLGASFTAFPLSLDRRKKISRTIFIISLFVITLHFTFKYFRLPGAAILSFLFFDIFAFVFLPLHTKNRIDKWKQYTRKAWHAILLSMADQVSLALVFGGLLFRVFHWPLANVFLFTGLIILSATVIGWNQLFSREIVLRKEAEEKVKDAFVVLKEQHAVIEEKSNEILASINYAKRLQGAILPSEKTRKNYLIDSFLIYQPKDIVAGDFYWIEKSGDQILFAAADCTGHGVPGALVSVVCNNALNRALKEFAILDPGKILDKTRELVIETFGNSEKEVKDGMDISLCSLNIKSFELKWAGANNPLWLLRDGADDLIEIKGDKQPIGKYAEEKPFTTHVMQLSAGDRLYLFTDGYADQFGGPMGKKFKYKQMKDLIAQISASDMDEQKDKIVSAFSDWRGNLEQVDDVCIIGVRV